MKVSKAILALSCALLLAGCAEDLSSSDSLDGGETSTSHSDVDVTGTPDITELPTDTDTDPGAGTDTNPDPVETDTNTEPEEPDVTPEPSETEPEEPVDPIDAMTLAELIEGLGAGNYTVEANAAYSGVDTGSWIDYCISKEVIYNMATNVDGVYYGPVDQGTAAISFSGDQIVDGQLLSTAKVDAWNFVYTVADIIADESEWELQDGVYVADPMDYPGTYAVYYTGYNPMLYDADAISLTLGEGTATLKFDVKLSAATVTVECLISNIGTTEYDPAVEMEYDFAAPTEWAPDIETYFPEVGFAIPEGVFGIGYYAYYDDDYLGLKISDVTANIDGLAELLADLLEADGWVADEYWTYDNYYAWTKDSVCFDYEIYTAEETEMPEIYPNGLVNISIYTSQWGF